MSTVLTDRRPTIDLPEAPDLEPWVHLVVDAIRDLAVHHRGQVGWPTWQIAQDPDAPVLRGGDPTAYDGDAGVLWALTHLAPALGRPDLSDLIPRVRRRLEAAARPTGVGLFDGAAGVALALAEAEGRSRCPGRDAAAPGLAAEAGGRSEAASGLAEAAPAVPELLGRDGRGLASGHTDHISGVSGLVLGALSMGTEVAVLVPAVRELLARLTPDVVGARVPGPDGGRPLCGLGHGQSGIALALGHALAAGLPGSVADEARTGLAAALAWESAWFDPWQGWPDLRQAGEPGDGGQLSPPTYPVWWCHGAAGMALTRLELLRLAEQDVDLGVDRVLLQAEAETAVGLCGRHVVALAGQVATLPSQQPQLRPQDNGLTVCHGLGGALDVLATAAELWQVPEHLAAARYAASTVATWLGPDPTCWPTGLRTRGGAGLFLGLSGTAMVLTRLAWPEAGVPSPSLFGVPRG